MQWVRKRHYFLAASLVVAIASFITFTSTIVLSIQQIDEPKVTVVSVSCFETSTAVISVATQCSTGQLDLGIGKLEPESSTVTLLNSILANRFKAAAQVALSDGVRLYITSGFRSHNRQLTLYKKEIAIRGSETEAAKWVLPPWYSHHPQGLAIDVNYPSDPKGAKWLEMNGYRFGLCLAYANEWWHFEGLATPGQSCPEPAVNAISDIDPSSIKLSPDQ
jgi:D-alanyl-D-alanine dipeptidase